MARDLNLVGGSPLIGSPLVYRVTAAVLTGELSFHKVKIEVTAGLGLASDDFDNNKENTVTLTFSSPVNSGETIYVDISSALRAAADNYVYSVNPPSSYPYIVFSLKAWDEYMQNGQETQKTTAITNSGGKAILGAFSDLERMQSGGNKLVQQLSRKPTAAMDAYREMVYVGEDVVVPIPFSTGMSIGDISSGPTSKVVSVPAYSSENNGYWSTEGRDFVILPDSFKPKDRYSFRFINSLGVMESYAVNSLVSQQMNLKADKYDISIQETFGKFSRGTYRKQSDYEKLKLSSSPLDKYWLSWFLHEFLMAEVAWIDIDGIWIPCHFVAEDTVTGIDRTKSDMISVEFTVELDINGSPNGSMAI